MRKIAVPFALTLLVSLILFFPYFFQKKVPLPIDIPVGTYYPWLADSFGYTVHPPVKNPILTDAVSQFWIWRNWAIEGLKNGEVKIWNPYSLSGYPMSFWFHTMLLSPLNVFYFFLPQIDAMSMIVISQITISLIGTYLLAKKWYGSKISAVTVSILWSTSSYFVGWLVWGSVSFGLAMLTFVLLSIDAFFSSVKRRKAGFGFVVFSLFMILSGHPQTILYMLAIVFLYTVLTVFDTRNFKAAIQFAVLFALILLILMPVFYYNLRIVADSIRFGESYLEGGNFGLIPWDKLIITIISVNFFGNPATYNYWGGLPNFQESLVNFGLLGFTLSVVGFLLTIRQKGKSIRDKFLIISYLTGFLLVTQFPFGGLVYKYHIPLISNIPAGRGFIFTIFAGCFLAGKMLNSLQKRDLSKEIRVVTVGIVAAFSTLALHFLVQKNADVVTAARNSLVSFIFLIFVLAIFLIGSKRPQIKKALSLVVAFLIFVEGYVFFKKYTPFVEKRLFFPNTKTLDFLKQKQNESDDFFRIERESGEILPPNMWQIYGLYSSSGYDPVYPNSYADYLISEKMLDVPRRFVELGNVNLNNRSELGVKYLLVLKRDERGKVDPGGEVPLWVNKDKWTEVFAEDAVAVLENNYFQPPYFFVNPITTSVKLLDKNDNKWIFEVITPERNRFVLIENTHPDWEVFVDNEKSDISIYKNTFKSVYVDAGKHNIKFIFRGKI